MDLKTQCTVPSTLGHPNGGGYTTNNRIPKKDSGEDTEFVEVERSKNYSSVWIHFLKSNDSKSARGSGTSVYNNKERQCDAKVPWIHLPSQVRQALYYKNGRFLSFRGYKFCRHRVRGEKIRWQCSRHSTNRCTACVLTINYEVARINLNHNHLPPTRCGRPCTDYIRSSEVGDAVYCKDGRFVLYEGYKFHRHRVTGLKIRWKCTRQAGKGCKACILTFDNEVIRTNLNHNHPP
ncbi:unnamed protein product [Chrysodeixis includens]|uniref:FLYWCH-type domain-containing protein n=1 Tax=Chrysodeixis includens TaxID=689277 RepID=A0A9N8PYT7_CHRIL|nr:unnamed protein product [Chrysodeixis includens]